MYRELKKSSDAPERQEPRKRTTKGNPATAPDSGLSNSTSVPLQRDVHLAPTKSSSNDHTPRATDFYSSTSYPPPPFVHTHTTTPAENTANRLRDLQKRFLRGNMQNVWDEDENIMKLEVVGLNRLDRRAVVNIYDEALAALSKAPSDHERIATECTRKTRVVLGLTTAEPEDGVFHPEGQLLRPLEPQYAEPRITHDDDDCAYRAQWRLNAWRRDGWPRMYPTNAIKREAQEPDEKLVGRGAISDARLMIKMHEDARMWEDGGAVIVSKATEQTGKREKKKVAVGKPPKVAKKNMTVTQPRQKVTGNSPANTDHESTSSSSPRTVAKGRKARPIVISSPDHEPTSSSPPRTIASSKESRQVIVLSPAKKKRKTGHRKAEEDEEGAMSETSDATWSSDENDGSDEGEDDDEDEWG